MTCDDPALDAARRASGVLGLDPTGAVVVRRAATVAVRLPAAGVFVRVHPPGEHLDARREVTVARALADAAVPAARLVAGAQPVLTEAGPVTAWQWLERRGAAGLVELGTAAACLHAATAALTGATSAASGDLLPVADPIAATRSQLAGITGEDAELLRRLADDLGRRWPEAADADPLGAAVIHADLHRDNVVLTEDGPVLVDLELAGIGPCSYDLAAIAVAGRRYGADPAEVDAAFAAYGADPRSWDGFEVLCDVYELWVTAWAVAHRGSSATAEAEATRRLTRWRTGSSAPWTLG